MAKGHFDSDGFYGALNSKRLSRKLTWKQVASESGVSASTLTRMAQGKRPDVDSLAALSSWSGLSADDYFVSELKPSSNESDSLDKIGTYLRADKQLSAEAANALEQIVRLTYEQLRNSSVDGKEQPPEKGL